MPDFLAQLAPAVGQALADLIGFLGHDRNATALAGGLVFAGLAITVVFAVRTTKRILQIRRVVAAVQDAPDAPGFAEQFSAISTRIEASSLLRNPWTRFKATLLFPPTGGDGSRKIQCTRGPSEFFTLAGINDRGSDFRGLPSIFLSLALLLTVIGVAASMSAAIKAVDDGRAASVAGQPKPGTASPASGRTTGMSTDVAANPVTGEVDAHGPAAIFEPMQMALRHLLDAGRASFTIAIAGLLISLLLTAALRICSSQLKVALQTLTAALQCRLELVSFEAVVLERLADSSANVARAERAAYDAAVHGITPAIEQTRPLQVDAAMARMQAVLERHSSASAEAGRADMRNLVVEFGKLIDDRVAKPVRSIGEQMHEQASSIREQLGGLVTLVNDNASRASLSASTGHGRADQLALASSPLLQVVEQSYENLAASSRNALRDLREAVNARIESNVTDPLRDLASSMAGLQAKVSAIQASTAMPRLAPQADFANEIQTLLVSLENSNAQIAVANRAAANRHMAEILERIEVEIAHPIRNVSDNMGEVRAKLATVANSVTQSGSGSASASSKLAHIDLLTSEVALLRQSIEVGIERTANDSRSAIRELTQTLTERLNDGALPHQGVAEAVSSINTKLARLDTALTTVNSLAASQLTSGEHSAQLNGIVSVLLTAISDGNDKVVEQNLAKINAVAEGFAQRLDVNFANPVHELSAVATDMRRTLSDAEVAVTRARDHLADGVDEVAQNVRLATDDMRRAIGSMASQTEAECDIARRTLSVQVRQSVEELGRATRDFEHNGAAVATRLREALETAPTGVSPEAEAAAQTMQAASQMLKSVAEEIALRIETSDASSSQELATVASEMRRTLTAIEVATMQTRDHVAGGIGNAAKEIRLATDEVHRTVKLIKLQAHDESELAGQMLVEQIKRAVDELGQATRHFEQNGAAVTTRLTQVIEAAPTSLANGAEAAVQRVQMAAESAHAHLQQAMSSFVDTTNRGTAETAAALTRISEQLANQAAHSHDVLGTQLASTVTGMEQASNNLNQAMAGLSTSLPQDVVAATSGVLDKLAAASIELRTVIERANDETAQAVAGIGQAATEARTTVASDLAEMRQQLSSEIEKANEAAAIRLQETATLVADKLAGYGGILPTTADSLVETLQALLELMRQVKTTIADHQVREAEFPAPLKRAANSGPTPAHRHLSGQPLLSIDNQSDQSQTSFQANAQSWQPGASPLAAGAESVATVLDRFIASKRAVLRAVD